MLFKRKEKLATIKLQAHAFLSMIALRFCRSGHQQGNVCPLVVSVLRNKLIKYWLMGLRTARMLNRIFREPATK